jgi:hypothetical protein
VSDPGDQITEETRAMAAEARRRAGRAPTADELAGLLSAAGERTAGPVADEVRRLATAAISQAQQVSFLLGKLSGLVGEADDDSGI